MKAPAFQFYPADFIMGTNEMTSEEVGGYIRLLCHQWSNGGLPENRKKIETISRIYGESLDAVLEKFTLYPDGRLKNDRMEKVREEQMDYRAKQAENGKKGGNPAFKKGQSNPYYNRGDNPKDNPPDMPPDNPKINSLPSSSPTSSSLSSSSSSGSSFEKEPKAPQPSEETNPGELFPDLTAETKKRKEKGSAQKEKKTAGHLHLFQDSPFIDLPKFLEQFKDPFYNDVHLEFYYHAVKDWSAANGTKKVDWIAVARGFMRRDHQESKLRKISNSTSQQNGQPTNSFGQKQQSGSTPSGAELAYIIASQQR